MLCHMQLKYLRRADSCAARYRCVYNQPSPSPFRYILSRPTRSRLGLVHTCDAVIFLDVCLVRNYHTTTANLLNWYLLKQYVPLSQPITKHMTLLKLPLLKNSVAQWIALGKTLISCSMFWLLHTAKWLADGKEKCDNNKSCIFWNCVIVFKR